MVKTCTQCLKIFEIANEDLAFYQQISPVFDGQKLLIPEPKLCPICRHQRRLSFRNERKLYSRKCDLSGKQILSIYSPDKPYKVYDQDLWWSDQWDGSTYARNFDFKRSFFEQFRELYIAVPRVSLHTINVENSYFTCYTLNMKNCYLIFGAGNDEDCMYGKYVAYCKDCVDSLCIYNCQFCYEGVASDDCYACRFFTNCRNCSECTMIEDCSGCNNCLACFGLRNKEYCYLNKFVGREKYEKLMKEYEYLTSDKIDFLKMQLGELKNNLAQIASHIYASENCTGEAIFNCKNCFNCFDCKNCEDCKYLYNAPRCVKTYDSVYCAPDGLQFCYNVCSTVGSNLMSTYFVWYCDSVYYSMDCINCRNLFGCVGLRNKEYCILNKEYSKQKYEEMVNRIIKHMVIEGEWGEYFPYGLAPCAYNETVAMEYFPLAKKQIIALGAYWKELDDDRVNSEIGFVAKADIREVGDEVCKEVFACNATRKQYKIMPAELNFYRRIKLPLPTKHPDQRHYDRLVRHGYFTLYKSHCSKCQRSIETGFESRGDLNVLCENCYLHEIY